MLIQILILERNISTVLMRSCKIKVENAMKHQTLNVNTVRQSR